VKLQHLFFILTQKLKGILTPCGHDFWCDGHPWLCVACIRLRYGVIYNSLPFALEIVTHRGNFIWAQDEAKDLPEYWLWIEGILRRSIKQKYSLKI